MLFKKSKNNIKIFFLTLSQSWLLFSGHGEHKSSKVICLKNVPEVSFLSLVVSLRGLLITPLFYGGYLIVKCSKKIATFL